MTELKQTNNIACRLFKEQLDLINQLPEQDRANVLYMAVMGSYFQFDSQFENQIDNQNEHAYISTSISLSNISLSVLELLKKNIIFKEYSSNYGGKRERQTKKENKNFWED